MELLAIDVLRVVPHAMHAYAARHGFGDGEVLFEPIASEVLLRDMLAELDRSTPSAMVIQRLQHVARSWGVDLVQVFNPPRRTDALWKILDSIDGPTNTHLLVPSHEHLTNLGPSGRAAVAQLTQTRTVEIHYLDATAPTGSQPPRKPPVANEQVLVESRIGAIPTVAQLDVASVLSRLGQAEIIEIVDAVYVALINDAITTPGNGALLYPPDISRAVIRLLEAANGQLIVELEEPRPRSDEVAASLTHLCESTRRFAVGGRTFTRCALPFESFAFDVAREGRR
ncbi:hypothetical protein HLB23_15550 [Nocardia uniformis]|uniref:Uncharacterized protein n=1 Tax=Nocardia uniformis TaxID=53432 RepID=A0A849C8S4_9NOCA|nr:hypothetical protein [Nocardia uniformis]NNH71259.1 hypothetical protein [Nocardia uniformis]